MAEPRQKLPIFIRRQLPKTIPSRLSIEEIEAVSKPAPELEIKIEPIEPEVKKVEVAAKPKPKPKPVAPTKPVVKLEESEIAEEPITIADHDIAATEPAAVLKPLPHLPNLTRFIRPVRTLVRHMVRPSVDTWLVLAATVGLLATQLTLIWFNEAGLAVNMAAVLLLTMLALFRDSLRKLSIGLLILPVSQMVSSTIITHNAFQTATIFYATLLVFALVYRYLFTLDEPVEASRLRWKGHFFGLPPMIILGQLLGLLGYGLLRNHYDYTHISLPLVFAACIVFAFAEEMLLRGLIQQQVNKVVHPIIAVILSSSLYVVLTISHGTMLSIIPAVATGVVLALVYHFKRNVLLTTAVNAASKLTYVGLVATFILR